MPRQPKPADLTILPKPDNGVPSGPNSSPINLQGVDLSSFGGVFEQTQQQQGQNSTGNRNNLAVNTTTLVANNNSDRFANHRGSPPIPQSPALSPRIFDRDPSRTFFGGFGKGKKGPAVEPKRDVERERRNGSQTEEELRPGTSSMSKIYHLRKAPGSTPELSLVAGAEGDKANADETNHPVPESRPQPQQYPSEENISIKKKDNKTFRNPLVRNKSVRRDSHSKTKPPSKDSLEQPPMTAPLQSDWPGAEARMLGKNNQQARRGKSAERGLSNDSDENLPATLQHKDSKTGFKTTSKNALSKAKTGGGNFLSRLGKIGRSGSSNMSNEKEKEVPDNEYVFRVINLPLVEQTRITRISKHINACRDKTEFWMPSLPWRCIDYLNSKCEYEGLYRVPGSGPQVKRWQRRFDTELDVDILKEDTYDVNEIASMLKAWLRELPTEIFPAHRQKELAAKLEQENPRYKNVGEPAPQLLRDALSELPPFNYYLLFAITCHLSLILGHKDQNRMDLNNLAVCVGPCLNLDRWLFNYLVGDWRNCWRGCNTEKAAQEVEKRVAMGTLAPQSERSAADAIRHDLQSEAQLRYQTAYPPVLDDALSATDEPVLSSASASIASKPSSSHNNDVGSSGKPIGFHEHKPLTYIPAGAKLNADGSLAPLGGLGIDFDAHLRRPSTAAASQLSLNFDSSNGNSNSGGTEHDAGSYTTSRVTHRRSHSDLASAIQRVAAGQGSGLSASQNPPLPLRPAQ